MPWDLALDGDSGDFMFGPTHDLLGTSGKQLTEQRMLIRCRIPRGSFTYDTDGTLGSRLNTLSVYPSERAIRDAPALVTEALADMDDIQLLDVEATEDENHRLITFVKYNPIISPQESSDFDPDPMPEFDATISY